jgi:PAS domain S-box-containing protein
MSALLALALQLGRTLQSNASAAEEVRLRLALGKSMDRAWSWDLSVTDRPAGVRESGGGQEVREGDWTDLVHPEDRPRVVALLRAHLQGHTPAFEAQYRMRKPGGDWGWLVDRGHVSERGSDGTPRKMLGVSGDVTERQRIDQERESSERRFRAIFDSAHHFQVLLDRDACVLEANRAALAALDAEGSPAGLTGKPFAETWWRSDDRTRERIAAAMAEAGQGRLATLEAEIEQPSGRLIYDFSIKPIRDRSGQVIQLLAEGLDITTARQAESKLREVETLSTMGRLAARVAHEINNPLAGIQNSFLLLRDAIPASHPHYAYVGAMEREIARIANVTRQLYETYRPESDGGSHAGVRTVIGDAIALLTQVNRPSQVTIRSELDRLPTEVAIPESVLRQSVYNLVQNAVEASPQGGTVTVRAEAQNGTFELRVRDHGGGIPEAIRPALFQPFVSTKGREVTTSGMGIGLSLVHRSVQAVGGSIEIVDPPDGGTEFVVRMPITGKPKHDATR